jgi:hypothetical protein
MASADSLTTHIHIVPSLKIGGAIPPLNLSPWDIVVQLYCTLTSYLCTYLSTGLILSGLIKEPFLYITHPPHAHYITHLFYLH